MMITVPLVMNSLALYKMISTFYFEISRMFSKEMLSELVLLCNPILW